VIELAKLVTMIEKLIVGIVAQNNAGKTEVATAVAKKLTAVHYSVRDKIRARYRRHNGQDIPSHDQTFQNFCQAQKNVFGPEVFIKEIVDDFMKVKGVRIGIIESIRAVGESKWLLEKLHLEYPSAMSIVLGITAPFEDRLGRFLKGRPDELSVRTKEGFVYREWLVNKGFEDSSENVEKVLEQATELFPNPDGQLQDTITQVASCISAYADACLVAQNTGGNLFSS